MVGRRPGEGRLKEGSSGFQATDGLTGCGRASPKPGKYFPNGIHSTCHLSDKEREKERGMCEINAFFVYCCRYIFIAEFNEFIEFNEFQNKHRDL